MITLEQYLNYTTKGGNKAFETHKEEMQEWNRALIARFPWLAYEPDETYYSTFLDDMPPGWYAAFGIQLCEEIEAKLKEKGIPDNEYEIYQVKEKFGGLRWYDNGISGGIRKIIKKYEELSYKTCCECGKPAKWISRGWICPYCDDCKKEMIEGDKGWWEDSSFVPIKEDDETEV